MLQCLENFKTSFSYFIGGFFQFVLDGLGMITSNIKSRS